MSQMITNQTIINIVAERRNLMSKDIAKILSEEFGEEITAPQVNKKYTEALHGKSSFDPAWKGIYGIPEIDTLNYKHNIKNVVAVLEVPVRKQSESEVELRSEVESLRAEMRLLKAMVKESLSGKEEATRKPMPKLPVLPLKGAIVDPTAALVAAGILDKDFLEKV
jgi:hypothetical protein